MNNQGEQVSAAEGVKPSEHGSGGSEAGEQALSFLSSIEKQVADLRRLTAETSRRAQEIDAREGQMKDALAELERALAEQRHRAEHAEAELERARSAAERTSGRAEQAERERAEFESKLMEQVRRTEETVARLADIQRQAEARSSEGQELLAKTRQEAEEHARNEATLREQLSAAADQAAALRRQVEEGAASVEQAIRNAEEYRALVAEAERERDALAERHAALTKELEQAIAARDEAAQCGAASGQEIERLHQTVAKRDEALRVLAERLMSAEQRLNSVEADKAAACAEAESLVMQLEQARAAAAETAGAVRAMGDEFTAGRRARLARYRDLLAEQSRKIIQAKAALKKKIEQVEETLALRARLTEQMQLLSAERAKAQAGAARTGTGVLLLCFFGVLAIVGGLAWAIAGQVAPATFAARAVLAADTPGRTPTQEELLTWTSAHERMLDDPDFMALAAERFGQRGMAGMGSPAAVKQRLSKDFSIHTDKAGVLTIELRGRGSERTERELETLALALIAMANSQREARGDGAATMLSEPPKVGSEPIEDQRLLYVAGFGGGGAAMAGVMFVGLYRVMLRSKRRFEQRMLTIENE